MARKRYSDEDILKLLREIEFICHLGWMSNLLAVQLVSATRRITRGVRSLVGWEVLSYGHLLRRIRATQGATASSSMMFRRCYGSSYISGELADWLDDQKMDHVRGAPHHPQTQGKIERWHQTLKNRILLENCYLPGDLRQQIDSFVDHYNNYLSRGPAKSHAR